MMRRNIEFKDMAMTQAVGITLSILILGGCQGSLDSVVWDCQLEVQKGNAGKSAEAVDERGRDIESCMRTKGYRLDVGNPSCRQGVVNSTCYRAI
jgi:hypothetical protein